MLRISPRRGLLACLLVIAASGCRTSSTTGDWLPAGKTTLTEVARSERQWTGMAISADGRIFVNYPLWSDEQPFALGELVDDELVFPFPDDYKNEWEPGRMGQDRFVCLQALLADQRGHLWVLDPASPRFEGVVPDGAKLILVDLTTGTVARSFAFDETIAPPTSYLNDLRLDLERGVAYLTDSGAGALVVLDLESGQARRVLDGHPSTRSEGITLVIEGQPWLMEGVPPEVHADGIALSPDGETLYYQALSGRNLYRIATEALRDASLSPEELGTRVEHVALVGPSDGLYHGPDGAVYLTSLEENAIRRVWPETGEVETVVQDPRLAWPDSFAPGPDGHLYVTTAQIHRGANPPEPYRIFRLDP